jgi:hypothetical protein
VVLALDGNPDALADLVGAGVDANPIRIVDALRWIVRQVGSRTRIRLCVSLGTATGTLLQQAVKSNSENLAFSAGFLAAEAQTVLAETGQSGWEAFESNLRSLSQAPALNSEERDVAGIEATGPWHRGDLLDLVTKTGGWTAHQNGMDPQKWGELRRAIKSGMIDAWGIGLGGSE